MHQDQTPARRKAICVFCGSSLGDNSHYVNVAVTLGMLIGTNQYDLIFGGGNIGLMSKVAEAASQSSAPVTAVIPDFLHKRIARTPFATNEVITVSMHERKARMFELADAFVALPGGIGTLEETVEMLTWAQLELHAKPIVLVNVSGYWNNLIGMIDHMIQSGFASAQIRTPLHVVSSAEEAITELRRLWS